MDIPIQNIYYMLCYAWDKLKECDIVNVSPTDCDNIEDLFARVLATGISHLLKKGLDRAYIVHHEETGFIRGRIDFTTTLKRTFFKLPKVYCEYDDLSYNILHNQILKSTIKSLMSFGGLSDDNKQKLHGIYRLLSGIDCIDINPKMFRRIQLHSNNYFYDFLLRICELIYFRTLPSEEAGRYKFRDFYRDKGMAGLFEAFVRNFYKQELGNAKVGGERIKWEGKADDELSWKILPMMYTDISIIYEGRKIIIDAKYYKEAIQMNRWNEDKLISENLYQLFAYLMNSEGKDELGKKCEGILLYPVVEKEHSYEYTIKGHRMAIKTINLNQNWKQIEKDLRGLIKLKQGDSVN